MADQPVRRPPTLAAAPVRLSGLLPGAGELSVTGVSLDSRRVGPGELYAALPGQHTHGARFAADAAARGALAVLTDAEGRPWWAICCR